MMETENRSWIVQVHTALEEDEAEDLPLEFVIWKVPSKFRTNDEQYKPIHWRFGLHHCLQTLDSNETEGLKVQVAKALQLTGNQWESFCKRVVFEPKKYWEGVYHYSPHASSYTIEEIRCRLSLDAIFLVVSLQYCASGVESLGPALSKVMKKLLLSPYWSSIEEAFYLVENQIPMKLLERVVGILVTECKDNVGEMQEWDSLNWKGGCNFLNIVKWSVFLDPHIDGTKEDDVFMRRVIDQLQHNESYCGVHILDSTYRRLCGWKSLGETHEKDCPPRYSATDLEACGVTIKGKEFTCFEDISFEKGCLTVPFLRIYNSTEAYLRNLIVHETLTRPNGLQQYAAVCYAVFMEGLMRTQEDVILLEKQGVLLVTIGSCDNVMDMWKRVSDNIPMPKLTNNFYTMMIDVSNYTKRRRNKYRFEFKKQFCSRPWIPLLNLAAVLVTLATLLQTYIAVIGSNGMKPRFSP